MYIKYKRAQDLFPPPISHLKKSAIKWDLKKQNIQELIDWLDDEKFTGVLKASSNNSKYRGALLLYAGWCVGAVYAAIGQEPIKHTHKALPSILNRLNKDDLAQVEIYELPEEIVLPYSSAFIGQFMEPAIESSPSDAAIFFMEHIKDLPRHCLITIRAQNLTFSELCLVFFYWGKISGYFLVEQQLLEIESLFPQFVLDQALEAKIHLSILSPEIDGVYQGCTRFGFPLKIEPGAQ